MYEGNPLRCVVDADGYYIDIVSMYDPQGNKLDKPYHHTPIEGERLLETDMPPRRQFAGGAGFVRPRWINSGWIEGATDAEIAAWEAENPAPELPPKQPTQGDINSQAIAELSIAQAQSDMVTQQALAELSILMASGGAENV